MKYHSVSKGILAFLAAVVGLCLPVASRATSPSTEIFTSTKYGYSFHYPNAGWYVSVEPEQEGILEIVNLRPMSGGDLIMVTVEDNSGRRNASQWFQERSSNYNLDLIEIQTDLQLAGNGAILLRQPRSCRTAAMLVTIFTIDDLAFTITYLAQGESNGLPVYQVLLDSLRLSQSSNPDNNVPPLSLPSPISGECPTSPGPMVPPVRCPDAPFYIPAAGNVTTPYRCWMDSGICPEYRPGSPYGSYFESPHRGLDLTIGDGPGVVDVYATATGVVALILDSQGVRLNHTAYNVSTYYAHMRNKDTGQSYVYVHVGDVVTGGQTILGKTGNWGTAATHLHFSIFDLGTNETDISNTHDPTPYLRANDLVYHYGWQRHAMECLSPLDTIPPTTIASYSGTLGENGWFQSSVVVTLTASDNPGGSGVALIRYQIDGGEWADYIEPFTISGDGRRRLSYQAEDNASNWEYVHYLLIPVDTTAPSGALALNHGSPTTYATLVRLDITASDATSGLWQVRLRDSSGTWGDWQGFAFPAYWLLPATNRQTLGVEIQLRDYAGNESPVYADSIYLNLHPARPISVNYRISKSTLGMSSSAYRCTALYCLGDTVAQPSGVSEMGSANYDLALGYWRMGGIPGGVWNIYLPLVTRGG